MECNILLHRLQIQRSNSKMTLFPSEQLLLTDYTWPRQKKEREKGISLQLISS